MTDIELLEKAAKAAGIGGGWDWPRGAKSPTFWRGSDGKAWKPLSDDGDALRLLVSLNASIIFESLPDGPVVKVSVPWHEQFTNYYWIEWLGKDASAATRRAITRAAAAIGETA